MIRLGFPISLLVLAAGITAAWLGCEGAGFGRALPVLVGEIPAGGAGLAVVQAAALTVSRLLVVTVAPIGVLAALFDVLLQSTGRLGVHTAETGKGPTPEPVGSTGGGL